MFKERKAVQYELAEELDTRECTVGSDDVTLLRYFIVSENSEHASYPSELT